jgi:hypothetical protein
MNTASNPRLPLRLPDGWRDCGERDGVHLVMADGDPPAPMLVYVRIPGSTPTSVDSAAAGAALGSALAGEHDDVLVLDTEVVRCLGGRSAVRVLAAVTHPSGLALTVEQWSIDDGTAVHMFTAIIPTERYASVVSSLHRVLRGARPASR